MTDELTRAIADQLGGLGFVDRDEDAARIAAALAPLIEARVREARADALTEAADEIEFIIANGDVAEVAAPVEGEVGRASAVSKRDRLYEEPVEWVRLRAEEVRRG